MHYVQQKLIIYKFIQSNATIFLSVLLRTFRILEARHNKRPKHFTFSVIMNSHITATQIISSIPFYVFRLARPIRNSVSV